MKTSFKPDDIAIPKQMTRNGKPSRTRIVQGIVLYIILIFHLLVCLYPLLWMGLNSFKRTSDIYANPWNIPINPTLDGYIKAFSQVNIVQLFYNSVFVCVIAGVVCLLLSCMVAYGIQRMEWKLKKVVLIIFLTGLMVPVHSIVLPLYTTFVKIGLNNTRWGLIIPYIVTAMPYSILILIGFLQSIPRDLECAAAIDGCSLLRIFFQITIPLLKPAIASIVIFNFVTMWNELFLALVLIAKKELYTLSLGVTMFRDLYSTDYAPMFAFLTLTIAVSIAVYLKFQKQIVAGIIAGAVKG